MAATSVVVFLCLFAFSNNALADTVVWDSAPPAPTNTDLTAGPHTTTVNGVTLTTTGSSTGTFDLRVLQIEPGFSTNGSTGLIRMQMDATATTGSDSQTVTFSFSQPVSNLSFTVVDIDGGPTYTGDWNDYVDFNSNAGFPTAVTASGVNYNAATGRANANTNTNLTDATGNITVTFAGPLTTVTVTHLRGPIVTATPQNQWVFIDDLTYTKVPATVKVQKVTTGGVGGAFSFTRTNLASAPAAITTTVIGTPTPAAPTAINVTTVGTAVTLTETPAAGFVLSSASCTDANGALTANPGTFGTVAGNVLTIPAANVKGGSDLNCTFTNAKIPTVKTQKTTIGGVGGPFTFAQTNLASAPAGITTTTAGTPAPAAPAAINVTTIGTAVTLTETPAAGYALTAVSCTDANSAVTGNTGSFGSFTGNVLTIPAVNIKAGADLNCIFTNTRATVKVQKTTTGDFGGPFNFAQTNLVSAPAAISTTAAGTPTPVAPTAINITTIGTAVTLTETAAAGYVLTSASCTDANSAVTGNAGSFGTLAGNVLTIPAVNVKAGADLNCVFTNIKRPTVTLTKISNGGVGGFTFTGTNGWASQTITTVTSGTGVTGALQTLTAAATSTTITEGIPAGYALTSVACSGLGSGGTAVPNLATGALVLDAAATAAGSNIACTFTNAKRPTVTLTKISNGDVGGFTFTGNNGWASQTITTVTSGTGVIGALQTLTAAATATTITEGIPAGYALASATCTGLGSGGTAIPNLATGALVLDAAATAAGSNIACTFTNAKRPTVTLTKISNGDVGGFTFTGNNGWASQTITTVTSGTGVAGALQTLTAAATSTTITEGIPAGYVLASATCTGLGSGGTAVPNLATGALVFDAAATAAGSNISCTFTNTKRPTVTLTKISNGDVGGFTFTGNNGWTSQTITTVTSGTGVIGALQTLTAAATATTITEGIPAGYVLASATCTGLGSGGTAVPNLATGALVLDAAATAAGSNIACTFTNTKRPTVTLTKISNGAVGGFTFTGTNGWASQTITTITSGTGVTGALQTLTSAATSTTITEGIPAGYALASATCTGLGSGGTAVPNLATGALVLDAAATAAGSNIACTFTNTKLPTVMLTKISNGGVGGFTFAGNNGWSSQTITTVTSGTGVAGALQTLTAASTATTITEGIPAGYVLASVTCGGLGGGGTATPNLSTGAVVFNAAATAAGSNIACTFTNTKLPTITLTKISNGDVGGFTFTGNNGWASQTITTVTSGTGVTGALQTLTAAATSTTITEGIPVGYVLASATCTGLGSGGTAVPNLATGALVLDAAATAAGSNIACTFTNTKRPTVTLTKISNGGVGGFTFTGNNGWASQTITTVTSGTGVSGALQTLTAAATSTTITEGIPAGYVLASATCSGLGSGGTAVPNLATGALVLDAAATAAGSNIACTFTNTRLPTVTLTKISNGGVGGFTFTGTNGWSSQTITTVTSGTGVSGALQTLTAAATATTITEGIPAGYALASAACTGLGSGGTAVPNLATGSLVLDAAATAAGSNIACTFTNTRLPTVTLTKISNGAVGGFTFTGNNGWTSQTITTVTSGTGVTGALQTLTSASVATTITEGIPAGYVLASVTCGGLGSGGTATPNLATGAVAFNAAATAAGSNIACTFTNTKLPTVTLTKISNGGVGGFTFTGTNGWASQTITTVTSGTGVAGALQTLTAAATSTTITEGIPAGYALTSATCTGLGSGGTAVPNLATGALVIDAAATAAGSNIACTFTNAKRPTITLTKISNGAVGAFTFTGDNGWTSQTITTVTSGTGVAGVTQILTAASAATTITEGIPAGYVLASVTCGGLGSGGTTTPNLATGAVVFNAAATAAGSNITCTFTNTKLPTITLIKISNGGVGGFAFTGDNGWASQTITTVTSGTGVTGATQTLTAASTATTITEGIPATFILASATCTGMGSGGTATPNFATGALVLNVAATAAGANITCTFTNTKLVPAMTVIKSASTAGPVSVGNIITYTFKVKNTGNTTITAIGLSETFNGFGTAPVPGNETLSLDTSPAGDSTDATANNGAWSTLGPGDEVTFTASYTVVQSDVDLLQ